MLSRARMSTPGGPVGLPGMVVATGWATVGDVGGVFLRDVETLCECARPRTNEAEAVLQELLEHHLEVLGRRGRRRYFARGSP